MTLWITLVGSGTLSLIGAMLTRRLGGMVPLLGSWIRLEHVENPGIAFGVRLPGVVLPVVLAVACAAIGVLALKAKHRLEQIAYGMILGGALANIIDRLPDGTVTDVVAVRGFSVFNLADAFITVGAVLLAWVWVRPPKA